MRIVLPGALPDPRQARELLPHVQQNAPALLAWLERSHATRIVADPAQTHCTAWEYWQLLQHDFSTAPGQVFSAGLGPMLAASAPAQGDEPVWLVELTHLSPSRDGAVLIPARELAIGTEDSHALLQSAQSLFSDSGFSLSPCTSAHWRIDVPEGLNLSCPSPELVATTTVNDWWTQDIEGRPWRRLANEIQMLWFDHPVNQKRFERGQVPINNLWLFGGARPSQLANNTGTARAQVRVDHRLLAPMLAQDWGHWLQLMAQLDAELFSTLDSTSELSMIGHDRIVNYTTEQRFWKRWLPGTQDSWKKWWSPQDS